MLHLRVICPAEVTDGVLERLRADGGTAHLTIVRGAAVAPPGDLVQADIAREAADGVLAALCELGVDHTGGITLEPLDTVLSDASDVAQETAPGDEADALVWDELVARTGGESRMSATYLAFLTLACLIAVVGLVTDSPVTIVGAMVSDRSSPRWRRCRWGWCCAGGIWCGERSSRWGWGSLRPCSSPGSVHCSGSGPG